jgi:hypothetical protein
LAPQASWCQSAPVRHVDVRGNRSALEQARPVAPVVTRLQVVRAADELAVDKHVRHGALASALTDLRAQRRAVGEAVEAVVAPCRGAGALARAGAVIERALELGAEGARVVAKDDDAAWAGRWSQRARWLGEVRTSVSLHV